MNKCIRCGLTKRSVPEDWVCDDCGEFSLVIDDVWKEVNQAIENNQVISPDANPVLQLLADAMFLNMHNTQTALFYKFSGFLITCRDQNKKFVSESELNKHIQTQRAWADLFNLFSELGFIDVSLNEDNARELTLHNKIDKFVDAIDTKERHVQVSERIGSTLGNYVMLAVLRKVGNITDRDDVHNLPYDFRPRTMWITLMFLWRTAYEGDETFTKEELDQFLGRRRITSQQRNKIMEALSNTATRETSGLIRELRSRDGTIEFTYNRYVVQELDRLREDRDRTSSR